VKLIDVYPNDYPDPNPNIKGVLHGGYQQLVRGEPFRGKFRKQPVQAGAVYSGQAREDRVLDAGISCTRSAPAHRIMVSDPEFLVPAGGPESAAIPGYFRTPARPISRRRWSVCFAEERTDRSLRVTRDGRDAPVAADVQRCSPGCVPSIPALPGVIGASRASRSPLPWRIQTRYTAVIRGRMRRFC